MCLWGIWNLYTMVLKIIQSKQEKQKRSEIIKLSSAYHMYVIVRPIDGEQDLTQYSGGVSMCSVVYLLQIWYRYM